MRQLANRLGQECNHGGVGDVVIALRGALLAACHPVGEQAEHEGLMSGLPLTRMLKPRALQVGVSG